MARTRIHTATIVSHTFTTTRRTLTTIVVSANVSGRDLGSVIEDIRATIDRSIKLPTGYYVVYRGQFKSERAASRTISLLGVVVVAGIFLLLFLSFRSTRNALLIMVDLPLALIGGVVAVYLTTGVLRIASIPLVLAGGETGNELQAPMGVVILGGLLSSTALNMLVVPALYSWLARPRAAAATNPEPSNGPTA